MKTNDMQQETLYGDWYMSVQNAFAHTRQAFDPGSRMRCPKPSKLDQLEALFEVAAILTLICGLLSPSRQAYWITLIVFGVLAFVTHLVQRHMHFL